MRVVIIPGMGCSPVAQCNWYSWFAAKMKERSIECVLRDFPDPNKCRESIWIPFILDDIGIEPENTVIVGHSSGAACAMRLLEKQGAAAPLKGAILVATAYTDMGDADERNSEYFSRPWKWDDMKEGAENIICFHGTDDHLIPVSEARHIAEKLKGDNFCYHEMDEVSHFFQPWQKMLDVFDEKFLNE